MSIEVVKHVVMEAVSDCDEEYFMGEVIYVVEIDFNASNIGIVCSCF